MPRRSGDDGGDTGLNLFDGDDDDDGVDRGLNVRTFRRAPARKCHQEARPGSQGHQEARPGPESSQALMVDPRGALSGSYDAPYRTQWTAPPIRRAEIPRLRWGVGSRRGE